MQVDYCYILSAGKGTRMGPIGEKIAKPLWPVFDKTLLELQVSYAQELGARKIFINVHHLSDQVENFIADAKLPVEVLYEPELLDVGGAVHNLKKYLGENTGTVLIINSDQFLFLEAHHVGEMLNRINDGEAGVLATTNFIKSQGYNALNMTDNKILGVIKNEKLENDLTYVTYSGVALIDLKKLSYREGISNFFQSVCHPSQGTFSAYDCTKMEYYDFGTLSRYCDQCLNIFSCLISLKTNKMIEFLNRHRAIKISDVTSLGYKSPKRMLNFTSENVVEEIEDNTIMISDPKGIRYCIKCE
jgi:choline kinase